MSDTRTSRLAVLLSSKERAEIEAAAKVQGLPLASYVRQATLRQVAIEKAGEKQ